jgi:hypothetical protein
MGKVDEIYRRNIYGVITTLTFHIVVLIILLLSNVEYRKQWIEDAVLVDFKSEELKLPDQLMEKQLQEAGLFPSNRSGSGKLSSNRAVNDADRSGTKTNDPFFDKDYNLSRKIPEIGDIIMPEENTKGKTREEVKQSNFKGKSNIHYYLENRFHVRLPIPVYLAEGGGEVTVDIVVGRDGRVLIATPRSSVNTSDMTLLAYAKQAAEKTWFNEDASAPEKQKGTITYLFVAQ